MKEAVFWNWFSDNKATIEDFINSDSRDYAPYETLTAKIKEYHPDVIPELTIDDKKNYVLIISCDGMRKGIEPVENLFAVAPKIDKWVIQKFRQPGSVINLNFKGLDIKSRDIRSKYFLNDNKVDIELYVRGYKESDQRYKSLTFLYLDHLVGEFLVMTKIGTIAFRRPGIFTSQSGMKKLPELAEMIKALV
ncbi:MAG TPA: hypothetical protein VGG71_15330 [Chitinophagaceae bacterium]